MLILAQPKSASTSLHYTLMDLLDRKKGAIDHDKLGKIKEKDRYKALPHTHREWHIEAIREAALDDKVYKHHIGPTENNMTTVREAQVPIILSLRNPADAVEAYSRHNLSIHHQNLKNYITDEAIKEKISAQMQAWYLRWQALSQALDHILPVYYDDLIINPEYELKRILSHHNLDESIAEGATLLKKRYTGYGIKKITQNRKESAH